jgi:hypothetical protein
MYAGSMTVTHLFRCICATQSNFSSCKDHSDHTARGIDVVCFALDLVASAGLP